MPAFRLDGITVQIKKYDVASLDSPVISHFIAHVGLFNDDSKDLGVERESRRISMVHMMPPLHDNKHLWPVSAIGTLHLSPGELQQIKLFCQYQQNEFDAHRIRGKEQYVIRPHKRDPDAEHPCCRYSCAGFVIEAYRWAGIELLMLTDDCLPEVPLDTLKAAYPSHAEALDDPDERAKVGLENAERWPVVLAGYVLNALARPPEEIRKTPYVARPGDELFPPRPKKAESP